MTLTFGNGFVSPRWCQLVGKTHRGRGTSQLDFEGPELQKHCLETMNISFGSNKFPQMSVLKSLEG